MCELDWTTECSGFWENISSEYVSGIVSRRDEPLINDQGRSITNILDLVHSMESLDQILTLHDLGISSWFWSL